MARSPDDIREIEAGGGKRVKVEAKSCIVYMQYTEQLDSASHSVFFSSSTWESEGFK